MDSVRQRTSSAACRQVFCLLDRPVDEMVSSIESSIILTSETIPRLIDLSLQQDDNLNPVACAIEAKTCPLLLALNELRAVS